MKLEKYAEVRQAVADLMRHRGCGCCSYGDGWDEASERLGQLLRVPKYKDGSGRDFSRFQTKGAKQ